MFEEIGRLQPRRRGHRRRPQGDVRLPRQGRPPHRAAARGHRVGGAGLRPAPAADAVEGLVRRAELPLRARPGQPVPPAPPARASRRIGTDRPRSRRRGRGHARTTSTGRSACARSTWSSTPSARRPTATHYIDRLRSFLVGRIGELDPERPGEGRAAPDAGARLEARREPGGGRGRRAAAARHACRRRPPRTSNGCSGASTALGIGFRIDPRLVRGLDYYTHTAFEFQRAALGGGPEHHRRRRALRRPGRVARRAADARASASARASSASCSPATPRACSAHRDRGVDVFVVDVTGGEEARDLTFELRRAGIARPSVRGFDGPAR